MAGLPIEITASPTGVIRPADLRRAFANPAKEARRLARDGVLLRLSHGYFAIVPEPFRGTKWRPSIEAVGLAIGQVDYDRDGVAGAGITAARLLDAIPRALGECVVAIQKQRPHLNTTAGRVHFVTRNVPRLDLQKAETELASGWITTAEQTVLDLADRPALGNLPPTEIAEAIRRLARHVDWQRLNHLARAQRKRPAAVRAAWVAGIHPALRARRRVSALGLPGLPGTAREEYGVI